MNKDRRTATLTGLSRGDFFWGDGAVVHTQATIKPCRRPLRDIVIYFHPEHPHAIPKKRAYMHKIWENRPSAPTPRWPWLTAPVTYEGRKGVCVGKYGTSSQNSELKRRRKEKKSTKRYDIKTEHVYANIEQTSNRNHSFAVRLRENGRNNSQHCCANNVGSCCVRVGSGVQTDATTPNIVGTCSASWEGYKP